ncbi:hypothetical protein MEG_01450 [Bartonella tamiae Th307]|uniref:Uncharacterized protein n=1 Tax=Bartonella tamiae Th239 TaxID=1094558 RepID=J0R5X3_9HYPH|nr:hypothetical protein ME5_00431 [Bartonella tamiae Th239]EJF93236.1 hypothetical protein MEG_01450 [Bartonella tamiae Th307]
MRTQTKLYGINKFMQDKFLILVKADSDVFYLSAFEHRVSKCNLIN